jgi:hypothetical protein
MTLVSAVFGFLTLQDKHNICTLSISFSRQNKDILLKPMKHQSCSKDWLQLTKYNVVSVEIQDSSGSSPYTPIQSGYQRKVVKTKTFLDPNFCLFQDGDLYLPFKEKQNKSSKQLSLQTRISQHASTRLNGNKKEIVTSCAIL